MRRLRIGIDCRSILRPGAGEAAGVGHYVHHLVAEVVKDARHEYVLFFDSHDAAEAKRELHADLPHVTARVLPFRRLAALPFLYSHMIVSAVFMRERLDVLHGPANAVPLFYRRPWVVTAHDFAIYDRPEWFPAGTLGTQSFSKSVLVPHSLQHATRVIAVSRETAVDAVRIFKLDERRVDVIHLGAQPAPAGGTAALPGRYFLMLGTVEPRKNIPTATAAFVVAAKAGWIPDDVWFAVAGGRGWKERPILDAIAAADQELGGKGRVRWVGYLPHGAKHAAMANAVALAFPSFKEGFGLPVLEAAAAGVPVIASDIGTTREILGDDAWYCRTEDIDGFSKAMRDVLAGDGVAERVARARDRAAAFTWEKTARETVRCYERAAEARVQVGDHDAS